MNRECSAARRPGPAPGSNKKARPGEPGRAARFLVELGCANSPVGLLVAQPPATVMLHWITSFGKSPSSRRPTCPRSGTTSPRPGMGRRNVSAPQRLAGHNAHRRGGRPTGARPRRWPSACPGFSQRRRAGRARRSDYRPVRSEVNDFLRWSDRKNRGDMNPLWRGEIGQTGHARPGRNGVFWTCPRRSSDVL